LVGREGANSLFNPPIEKSIAFFFSFFLLYSFFFHLPAIFALEREWQQNVD
jgi:hypothetical protein